MIPPLLPASSGSSFEGKSDRSTMRDRARSAQHGDAIFLRATNLIFIFICYYSMHRLSVHAD